MALEPEGEVAGGRVGVAAEPAIDVEALAHPGDQLFQPLVAGFEHEVGGAAGGRGPAQLVAVIGVHVKVAQHPRLDDRQGPGGDALAVVEARSQSPTLQWLIGDGQFFAGDGPVLLVGQERAVLLDGAGREGFTRVPEQPPAGFGIDHHDRAGAGELAAAESREGPLQPLAGHRGGRGEVFQVAAVHVPVRLGPPALALVQGDGAAVPDAGAAAGALEPVGAQLGRGAPAKAGAAGGTDHPPVRVGGLVHGPEPVQAGVARERGHGRVDQIQVHVGAALVEFGIRNEAVRVGFQVAGQGHGVGDKSLQGLRSQVGRGVP